MARKNVVGLFDNTSDAQAVVRELRDDGFSGEDISLVASDQRGEYRDTTATDSEAAEGAGAGATGGAVLGGIGGLLVGLGALTIPGIGPVVTAGTLATVLGSTALGAGIGAAAGGLVGALVGAGIPEEHANVYAEGVRRGGTLVMAQADTDADANRAVEIMNRHNVIDVERRGQEYRSGGWDRFDENATPYSATAGYAGTTDYDTTRTTGTSDYDTTRTADYGTTGSTNLDQSGEVKIPVVEEELRVGKREVETGGVRVNTRVEEQPINEQVTLREETVDVHRRPVDRPVSDADIDNLQEGTFEVREHGEEAIVDKQARVVEEVHIKKDAQERTENVQDTVRRTDVDVEQIPGQERTRGGYDTQGTMNRGTTGDVSDEGPIERTAGNMNQRIENTTGLDTDRSGDVGDRDRRDNY